MIQSWLMYFMYQYWVIVINSLWQACTLRLVSIKHIPSFEFFWPSFDHLLTMTLPWSTTWSMRLRLETFLRSPYQALLPSEEPGKTGPLGSVGLWGSYIFWSTKTQSGGTSSGWVLSFRQFGVEICNLVCNSQVYFSGSSWVQLGQFSHVSWIDAWPLGEFLHCGEDRWMIHKALKDDSFGYVQCFCWAMGSQLVFLYVVWAFCLSRCVMIHFWLGPPSAIQRHFSGVSRYFSVQKSYHGPTPRVS